MAAQTPGAGFRDVLLGFAEVRAIGQGQADRLVGTLHRGDGRRRFDQLELGAGRFVEQDGQLLLQVRDLVGDLLQRLLAFHQGGAGLQVAGFGQRLGPRNGGHRSGTDALGGQQAPEELLDAAKEFTSPFFPLGLGNLLIRPSQLDTLADFEQVRDRLHDFDRVERGVLVEYRKVQRRTRERGQRSAKRPLHRAPRCRQHRAEVVVEAKVDRLSDDLGEVVGLHRRAA